MSQLMLARAWRTLRAHLSTAILRKTGSLQACEEQRHRTFALEQPSILNHVSHLVLWQVGSDSRDKNATSK